MDEPGSLCSASAFFMLSRRGEDFAVKHQAILESKRASPGVCKTHSWPYLPSSLGYVPPLEFEMTYFQQALL
ncbi:hypothetical protein KSZ_06520 [Dictyobacter formicarum]|uniref:Uncharacterized protein n=1 Tax=Dictyobacter formicarum TaxID=2778368 RepID=A0ABQ3VAY5_9CHLR|nr:hypothetical protein KSZ_06520 [Dictyobacter formicarum]